VKVEAGEVRTLDAELQVGKVFNVVSEQQWRSNPSAVPLSWQSDRDAQGQRNTSTCPRTGVADTLTPGALDV
jgi:hypothetical protein